MFFEMKEGCTKKEAKKNADEAHRQMVSLDKKLALLYKELDKLEVFERDGLRHDEAEAMRLQISIIEESADREERLYDYWLRQRQWAVR